MDIKTKFYYIDVDVLCVGITTMELSHAGEIRETELKQKFIKCVNL